MIKESGLLLLAALWFMLPAAVANFMPWAVRRLRFLAVPVDFGIRWRGKAVFGPNKSWRGVVSGTLAGFVIFLIQRPLYALPAVKAISRLDYATVSPLLGLMLGLGAMLGDLAKSFVKRRLGIAPGKPWIPFDQLDWIAGALLLSLPFYVPDWPLVLALLGLGFAGHLIVRLAGWALGLTETKF